MSFLSTSPPIFSSPEAASTLLNLPPPPLPPTAAIISGNNFNQMSILAFISAISTIVILIIFILRYYKERLRPYQTRVHDIEARIQSRDVSRLFVEFQSRRILYSSSTQPRTVEETPAEEEASAATMMAYKEIMKKTEKINDCVDSCAICVDGFEEEEICRVIENCGHFFHKDCIDQWLRIESSCPLCRSSVYIMSPHPHQNQP